MKKMIVAFALVILAFVGFGTWVYYAEQEQNAESIPLHEQNVVVTSVEESLEGFDVEVTVQQAEEGGNPVLEILLTNNGKEDVDVEGYDVYYRDGNNWKKRMTPEQGSAFLLSGVSRVYCPENAEMLKQTVPEPDRITNNKTLQACPWKIYQYMEYNGLYRIEYTITGVESGEVSTLVIEWKQENK